MAEPIRPAGETPETGNHVADEPATAPSAESRRDATDQRATTGEPTAQGSSTDVPIAAAERAPQTERVEHTRTERMDEQPADRPVAPAAGTTVSDGSAGPATTRVVPAPVTPAPAPPAATHPTVTPARANSPTPPKRRSNRLAGTAWVLLAAGLFQIGYFGAVAAVQAALSGPNAVVPFLTSLLQAQNGVFGWLPVLFFFLLFELTVLISGRAGRFFYVVASGIVALLVYALSVVLISIVLQGAMPDANLLAQRFQSPLFILIGIVAREVMLWTGFAIGARGKRLRARDRADRERYDREVAAGSSAAA